MAKRGNGEGSIYKRTDGRWCAAISAGLKDGKPLRKCIYGQSKAEVRLKLTKAKRDQDMGLPVAVERQKVSVYLHKWLENSAKPSVRPKTYVSYEQLIRVHINPSVGSKYLEKLAPQHIQQFMNDKLAEGLSTRTVQYLHAVLRRALGQALKWGLVARNVAKLVDAPRVEHKVLRPFTPEEAQKFLEAVKGNRLEALYSVALSLGLRQGEALGLRWEDVDLENGTLSVRYALQRIKGKLELVEPKTKKSRRTIALPSVAVNALTKHKMVQEAERQWAADRWQEARYVFTSTIGTPLDDCNVTHQFHRILKTAGLPRLRFHDLRHTCATLLIAQGVHPRYVMEILGHSQIGLTMNTYGHAYLAVQREAATEMDKILNRVAVRVAVKESQEQVQ
jgi:integrase